MTIVMRVIAPERCPDCGGVEFKRTEDETWICLDCGIQRVEGNMRPCINCGKEWDERNCKHCGLSLRLWVKSGLAHNPSEQEMDDFLKNEYAALARLADARSV